MKKLLFAMMLLISASSLHAQPMTKGDDVAVQNFSGDLFDGISGIMVYSLYQNNNYLMTLYSSNNISKDSAFDMALHQVRASEYVLSLVDNKIMESSFRSMKKSDQKYLRELKSSLIVISGQAKSLKEYIEGGGTAAYKKFNLNKATAQRMVNGVLRKE